MGRQRMAQTLLSGSSKVARYAIGLCNIRTTHSRAQWSARSPALGGTIYQTVCPRTTSLLVRWAGARASICTAVNSNDQAQDVNLFWSEEVKVAMQQQEEAEGILELIQQKGLTPDNNFFVALIQELGAVRQPERAEAVLELMKQSGVTPDNSTFNSSLISLFYLECCNQPVDRVIREYAE